MYVYIYVYAWMHVCVGVYVCICRPEIDTRYLFRLLSTVLSLTGTRVTGLLSLASLFDLRIFFLTSKH